jgi:hypothetical protein
LVICKTGDHRYGSTAMLADGASIEMLRFFVACWGFIVIPLGIQLFIEYTQYCLVGKLWLAILTFTFLPALSVSSFLMAFDMLGQAFISNYLMVVKPMIAIVSGHSILPLAISLLIISVLSCLCTILILMVKLSTPTSTHDIHMHEYALKS